MPGKTQSMHFCKFNYNSCLRITILSCRFISTPTTYGASAAKGSPIFSDNYCRITTGQVLKAAMNRPERFRGLATDPGVQRKAP
jgi:hypothetical protein